MLSGSLELLGRFRSYIAERPSPSLRRVDVGHVAEWLRNGLQNRVRRFNSGRGLHSILKRLDHSWSVASRSFFGAWGLGGDSGGESSSGDPWRRTDITSLLPTVGFVSEATKTGCTWTLTTCLGEFPEHAEAIAGPRDPS